MAKTDRADRLTRLISEAAAYAMVPDEAAEKIVVRSAIASILLGFDPAGRKLAADRLLKKGLPYVKLGHNSVAYKLSVIRQAQEQGYPE